MNEINNLELLEYVYQGPERFVNITRNGERIQGALVNQLKQEPSLHNLRFIGTLNGHKIIDLTIPRIDNPAYHW